MEYPQYINLVVNVGGISDYDTCEKMKEEIEKVLEKFNYERFSSKYGPEDMCSTVARDEQTFYHKNCRTSRIVCDDGYGFIG